MKYCSIIVCHYAQTDDFGIRKKHDRSELMKKSLASLITNTDYPSEIIVIDNGGNPDDSDYLLDLARRGLINTYVKNKENMYFGWAWNQGVRLATGDHVCLTCNDIEYGPNWLSQTIKPLLDHPEKKLIAAPIVTGDKDKARYYREPIDGYRTNTLAGSNCMIMTKETFYTIGEMTYHSIAGTVWHRRMHSMGYLIVIPPQNVVKHLAYREGVDYRKRAIINKTLLKGERINYTHDIDKCISIRGCRHQKGLDHRCEWLLEPPHQQGDPTKGLED